MLLGAVVVYLLVRQIRDPEDAYRFARGEEVVSNTGLPAKLSRPLLENR